MSDNQINAVVPFETSQSSTPISVQVVNNGASLNTLTYSGTPNNSAAVFTYGNIFGGEAYALNPDGSFNGPNNPASAGSAVTLLMTGAGLPTNGQLPVNGSLGTGFTYVHP